MTIEKLSQLLEKLNEKVTLTLAQPETFTQFGVIVMIYVIAFLIANRIRVYAPQLDARYVDEDVHPLRKLVGKLGGLIFPILAVTMLRISAEIST